MGTALEKVQALRDQLAAAEEAAAGEIQAAKKDTMAEVMAHLQENKITLAELSVYARLAGSKYSNGKDTWSGKGKKPEWVVKALAGGHKIEEYLTTKPVAESAAADQQPLAKAA